MSDWGPEADDYMLLVRGQHSPAKAAEIVLDAKRGCPHARQWITIHRAAITKATESERG